ncbi:hypothetical protein [Kineosporia succinea]|uniref:Uncharacterized protein n=1 Tax=Kineosporia succinea TaxID=84632 RepID=A0ABT9PDN6_9ACTN|nr:hypothetical protein [Kineosporia succinea]MDP9830828.1 hypothetical protein [Kineosporia succinea]
MVLLVNITREAFLDHARERRIAAVAAPSTPGGWTAVQSDTVLAHELPAGSRFVDADTDDDGTLHLVVVGVHRHRLTWLPGGAPSGPVAEAAAAPGGRFAPAPAARTTPEVALRFPPGSGDGPMDNPSRVLDELIHAAHPAARPC